MLAITFIAPPQCAQVSTSILNTRFNRCAHVIETWAQRARTRRRARRHVGRAWPALLVHAAGDSARQFILMAPW